MQTIGRAARNVDGQVIMYADKMTDSMTRAIDLTNNRRASQVAYNAEHGINPQTIRKAVGDILSLLRPDDLPAVPGKDRRRQRERDKVQRDLKTLPQQEMARLIQTLEEEMHEASRPTSASSTRPACATRSPTSAASSATPADAVVPTGPAGRSEAARGFRTPVRQTGVRSEARMPAMSFLASLVG